MENLNILHAADLSVATVAPSFDASKARAKLERAILAAAKKASGVANLTAADYRRGRDAEWYRAEYARLMSTVNRAQRRIARTERKVRVTLAPAASALATLADVAPVVFAPGKEA